MPINTIKPDVIEGQFSFRNRIINGKMEIAQRATQATGKSASGYYAVDRMAYWASAATTAVVTIDQLGEAPSGFQYSNSVTVTTADTTSDAAIQHVIEGHSVKDIVGRPFTLSFWVRASKAGTYCISFSNSPVDASHVVEYVINTPGAWEKKVITVSGGIADTIGTWNFTTGAGLRIYFTLAAGTTYQTATTGSWQTGHLLGTANQVNLYDTVGNTFAITGVQLEAGEVATPFEHRPYGLELNLCQRYYYQTLGHIRVCAYSTGGYAVATIPLPCVMRATPTMTETNGLGWSLFGWHYNYASINILYNMPTAAGNTVSAFTASAEL